MIISIKGKETDQHAISVDTVIKIFHNFSRFIKEFGKSQDITNLDLQIIGITKTSFSFHVEPRIPEPLLAVVRQDMLVDEIEKFITDFESENESNLEKYPANIKYSYAKTYVDFNELIEKDYKIELELKKRFSINRKEKEFLDKYQIKTKKSERIVIGTVAGYFSVDTKNRFHKVEQVEYMKENINEQITFNYVLVNGRKFVFHFPITTNINKNEDGIFEIRLTGTDQIALGLNIDDAIQDFRELIEILYDEFYNTPDEALDTRAISLKKMLKKSFSEEKSSENF